jgi:hypothetical protein
MRPLDLEWPGLLTDCERRGDPQDDRIDIISVGRHCARARTSRNGPRASTKGRVEARSRLEKNDRTDLVTEDRSTTTS